MILNVSCEGFFSSKLRYSQIATFNTLFNNISHLPITG